MLRTLMKRLSILFCLLFISGCTFLEGWYIPRLWTEPASYIDDVGVGAYQYGGGARYHFDSVAAEMSDSGQITAIWGVNEGGSSSINGQPTPDVSMEPSAQAIYVKLGEPAKILWVGHSRVTSPESYAVYFASDVSLTQTPDYVQGSFKAEGQAYKIQDGILVPHNQTQPERTFYFQLKINPPSSDQDEILKLAQDEFGQIVNLVLQKMNK